MGITKKNAKQTVSAAAYATAADFKQIFTEDVDSLYLLSLLLTGDPETAEKCFVEGLGQSTKGSRVFKEWARSWARRTIIQTAIRLITPRELPVTAFRTADVAQLVDKVPMILRAEVCAILELAPLQRFVFVISVLEHFSDQDCSILLGCAPRDIVTLRARAMQRLARLLALKQLSPADIGATNSIPPDDVQTVIELMIAQRLETLEWDRNLSK